MTIDIIKLAELVSAFLVVGGVLFAIFKWVAKQNRQDDDIQKIKAENTLLVSGLFACLDGLEQLGANHTVPIAKAKLEEYINQQAHS